MRKLLYLDSAENMSTCHEWEETGRGVIIPVGAASEVLIPWCRVLEVWDVRGKIRRTDND